MLRKQGAQFLLHVRDKCKTSQKAMFKVLDGVQQLVDVYLGIVMVCKIFSLVLCIQFCLVFVLHFFFVCVQEEIHRHVDPCTQAVNVAAIREILEETLPFTEVFSQVKSKTQLDNYLVNSMEMIPSEKVLMGTELVWKKKPRIDLVETDRFGYVIPFLPAIKRLLQNKQIRHCVDNPRPHGEKLISILDGQYYRAHPFFSTVRNPLAIILYYDELEIVNPLGSRTHKLGMFYWTLANIYPEFRSTLRSINLYAIVRYSYIKKFGIDKILNNFVASLQLLQNDGVTVTVNGENKTYRGSLLAVTADYPAAGLVGGFKKAVTAAKLCRRCMTDQEDWKLYFQEHNFVLRNLVQHVNDHLPAVLDNELTREARKYWSRSYGVNARSPLLDIEGFDLTKCLVQDTMHVIAEGVLEVSLRNFLKYCVDRNFVTIDELNRRINFFNYGHMSRDKPSGISHDHLREGLKQTASQMVCLGHIVPFLIRDKLKGDDGDDDQQAIDHLLCHVKLLQIINICNAFEISRDEAALLRLQIDTFIHQYVDLYPNTLVPKFHFLVHIVNQILSFGPPRTHNCMRFEAAHAWFRSTVPVVRNFKNMPLTLVYRYEALRCAELGSLPGNQESVRFLYANHEIKEGIKLRLRDLEDANLLLNIFPNADLDTTDVMMSPCVTVHGCKFEPGSIILVACAQEELPSFAQIINIYICNGALLLAYKTFDTEEYCPTLNAYSVDLRQFHEPSILNVKDLIHPHTFSVFLFEGESYIVLLNHARSEFVNELV